MNTRKMLLRAMAVVAIGCAAELTTPAPALAAGGGGGCVQYCATSCYSGVCMPCALTNCLSGICTGASGATYPVLAQCGNAS
jgi:hypothetical protein